MAGQPGPNCTAPTGSSPWTEGSRLAGLKFEQALHHLVLEDYIAAVEAAATRRDRLTAQIATCLPEWKLAPVVAALQTMRGMALVNAATLIAELGDLARFANPRQLMAYLGLVPSEHSSGASVRRGGLTKAGNGAARRLLIEAAWCYRFPARVSRELLLRQEEQPKLIRELAWKAQVRGSAPDIAGSRAPASRPMSSPPRSPASWWALSGPSPAACRRQRTDQGTQMIASRGGASEPADTLLPGQAGGAAAVRRTLASTICRIGPMLVARPRQLRDASPVMRFRPAHQSLINRRHDGRASRLAR